MFGNMRRHSLRLQHELHRWSICNADSNLLSATRVPSCISRSKSYASSTGESASSESWSSSDSVVSSDSVGEVSGTGSCPNRFRVVLLGGERVGKSALARIFAGAADSMESDDCEADQECEQEITVDGECATITLVDTWDAEEGEGSQQQSMQTGDAYLLVYSITDRNSFLRASELRISLRRHQSAHHTPIILVGNKCDLVRCREVSVNEGRACAAVFDCKFIETSAAVDHNVWEAFHGIVRQLRLRRDTKENNERRRNTHCHTHVRRESMTKKAKRFLDKMVARNNSNAAFRLKSKSCHDLSVL